MDIIKFQSYQAKGATVTRQSSFVLVWQNAAMECNRPELVQRPKTKSNAFQIPIQL